MSKIVYIIPGFRDSPAISGYKEMSKTLTKKGIENKIIKIHWNNRVMSDYVKEAISQLDLSKEIYLIGFSYGAFISFLLSTQVNVRKQFLLSLSPYFKEDLDKLKDWWKRYVGKRRIEDLKNFSFNELSQLVKCPTSILVGEKEYDILLNRAKDAKERIKNSDLLIVKEAIHHMNDKHYINAIKEALDRLD